MREQIVISGIGGQGVLFLTRVLAEAAVEMGLDAFTSETHGMAMRGGSVISHVKVGPFASPLIRAGQADCGLFLHAGGLEVHREFLKPDGRLFINAETGGGDAIDATRLAREQGSPLIANLVLLGYALRQGGLFCGTGVMEAVIRRVSPAKQLETNLAGLRLGLA
jgi:indolepyruvate ferredoxin oxidoreductase beta subunit